MNGKGGRNWIKKMHPPSLPFSLMGQFGWSAEEGRKERVAFVSKYAMEKRKYRRSEAISLVRTRNAQRQFCVYEQQDPL